LYNEQGGMPAQPPKNPLPQGILEHGPGQAP
jgi:hypothetical protein